MYHEEETDLDFLNPAKTVFCSCCRWLSSRPLKFQINILKKCIFSESRKVLTYSQLLEYIFPPSRKVYICEGKGSSRDAKNKAHIKVAQFLLVESEDQLTDYGQSCGDLRKHKMNVCMLHLKKKVLVTNICKQWICSLFIKDIIFLT